MNDANILDTPVYFDLDGFHVRTAYAWANSGTTPREHATKHGFAGSWKANGAYITCTRDTVTGKIIRRDYRRGLPRKSNVPARMWRVMVRA